jgi:DNA repair and recombination protein RAD54B
MVDLRYYRKELLGEGFHEVLGVITVIRKLLNHPQLVWEDEHEAANNFKHLFPSDFKLNDWTCSMKFRFINDILENLWDAESKTSEKIIIVSYYSQTLDLIEKLLIQRDLKWVRLDGKVAGKYLFIKKKNI